MPHTVYNALPFNQMSQTEAGDTTDEGSYRASFSKQSTNVGGRVGDLFSIPTPIKKLFEKVPVLLYPPNELPQRAPKPARLPSLYVFIKEKDAAAGKPSFNPSCLKWQVCRAGALHPNFSNISADLPQYCWNRPSPYIL